MKGFAEGLVLKQRQLGNSLRSKRFRGVGEQRKTKGRYFARAKLGREPNKKEGVGEGKEGNACNQTPGFWKPPFASERGSWLARPVEHYWHVSVIGQYRQTRGSLFTKFFAEQGFSHELRQHGGNPVMQCRRFGISKQAHYCPRKCDTVFVIFFIRCFKRLLPKFQRLPVVCLVTDDNTRNDFFPLACRFFTGVDFVAVRANFTLYYPGSQRVFFWWRSCDSRDLDGSLDKNYLHIMFTQYTDALALMRGFAAHTRSFVTKILESFKNDVYSRRQTVKITSDFLFSSCNPYINHTKIDKCLLLFTTDKYIFTLLYRQLKTVGKNFIFAVCRLT